MLWNFTIHLKGVGEFTDELAESLYACFADGAIVSSNGCTRISFGREANTLQDAIRSAVNDVRRENLDVDRVEIEEQDLIQEELLQWQTA